MRSLFSKLVLVSNQKQIPKPEMKLCVRLHHRVWVFRMADSQAVCSILDEMTGGMASVRNVIQSLKEK